MYLVLAHLSKGALTNIGPIVIPFGEWHDAGLLEHAVCVVFLSLDEENRGQELPLLIVELCDASARPIAFRFANESQQVWLLRILQVLFNRKETIVEDAVHQALHHSPGGPADVGNDGEDFLGSCANIGNQFVELLAAHVSDGGLGLQGFEADGKLIPDALVGEESIQAFFGEELPPVTVKFTLHLKFQDAVGKADDGFIVGVRI